MRLTYKKRHFYWRIFRNLFKVKTETLGVQPSIFLIFDYKIIENLSFFMSISNAETTAVPNYLTTEPIFTTENFETTKNSKEQFLTTTMLEDFTKMESIPGTTENFTLEQDFQISTSQSVDLAKPEKNNNLEISTLINIIEERISNEMTTRLNNFILESTEDLEDFNNYQTTVAAQFPIQTSSPESANNLQISTTDFPEIEKLPVTTTNVLPNSATTNSELETIFTTRPIEILENEVSSAIPKNLFMLPTMQTTFETTQASSLFETTNQARIQTTELSELITNSEIFEISETTASIAEIPNIQTTPVSFEFFPTEESTILPLINQTSLPSFVTDIAAETFFQINNDSLSTDILFPDFPKISTPVNEQLITNNDGLGSDSTDDFLSDINFATTRSSNLRELVNNFQPTFTNTNLYQTDVPTNAPNTVDSPTDPTFWLFTTQASVFDQVDVPDFDRQNERNLDSTTDIGNLLEVFATSQSDLLSELENDSITTQTYKFFDFTSISPKLPDEFAQIEELDDHTHSNQDLISDNPDHHSKTNNNNNLLPTNTPPFEFLPTFVPTYVMRTSFYSPTTNIQSQENGITFADENSEL